MTEYQLDASPDLFIKRLESDLARVRESLVSFTTAPYQKIQAPIQYTATTTGRLFRPTLVLISSYLTDQAPADRTEVTAKAVIDAAAAVELLHVATLCHDDLIDEAQTRRGKPTCNAKFGDTAAILVGDYFLARSMQIAAFLGAHQTALIAETLSQLCVGQMLETAQTFDTTRSESDYLAAISGKTAWLMRTCTTIGAVQCGADQATQEALAAFGHSLGMAFQIWDDILDLLDDGNTGKTAAKDLANGVYTLPVIYLMKELPDHLVQALSHPTPSTGDVVEILSFVRNSDVISRAGDVAQRHIADAISVIRDTPCFEGRRRAVEQCLFDVVKRLAPKHPGVAAIYSGEKIDQ
jgi:heptaprenyl diphosphate synthase